jgi:hypothetical protein
VDDDWQGLLGLSTRYEIPLGVWVEVGATYTHLFDPVDEQDVPTRIERDQMDYFVNIGLDQAFQRLVGRRWKLEFSLDVRTRDFQEHEFNLGDRWEWEAGVQLSYMLREELDAYIRYSYGETYVDSIRLNDGNNHQISLGLNGAIDLTDSGRLQGQLFVGFKKNNFDASKLYEIGSADFYTDDEEDTDNITAGIQLRYLMGTRTTWTLLYTRDTNFSLKGNYQFVDRVDLSLTRILMERLTGRLAGYFEYDQPNTVADVYQYGAGAGVRYQINDFMDADLSYDARWRVDLQPSNGANIAGNDYFDQRVILALTFYLR